MTDEISDSIEKKPPGPNIQSAVTTESEENTELEENDEGSKNS